MMINPREIFAVDRSLLAFLLNRYPVLLLACGSTAGILLDSVCTVPAMLWFVIAVVACGLLWRLPARHRWVVAAIVFVPVFALRHAYVRTVYDSASIFSYAIAESEPAVVRGVIDTTPTLKRHPLADQASRQDSSKWQTGLTVRLSAVRDGPKWANVNGRALVTVNAKLDELLPGDKIEVYGSLQQFSAPNNPGQFDLRDVYRRRQLHVRVNVDTADQIVPLESTGWSLNRLIAKIAVGSRQRLTKMTGESTAALAVALVIGQRGLVDDQTRDRLLVTGTAHLLSVSGLHLAIIVWMTKLIVSLLRFRQSVQIICIVAVCVAYTMLTGSRPPVIRAAVLVGMIMAAIWIRRPNQSVNALALAALCLLAYNPELLFSIGVQLSFLAVTTLITCGSRSRTRAVDQAVQFEAIMDTLADQSRPWVLRYGNFLLVWTKRAAWYSACVTVVSMPLVWMQFHIVSIISVFVNVVLSLMLMPALVLGVLTATCSLIWEPLGHVFGSGCHGMLWTMDAVIMWAANVPYGHFWLPAPPLWLVITFYVVAVYLMTLKPNRLSQQIRWGCFGGWTVIALLVSTSSSPIPDDTIEATFINVGHGTSVIIRDSHDQVWLYDCGRLANDSGSSRDIDEALWALGVTRLDTVFLSHADSDHFNALPGIVRRFQVNEIVTPPGMVAEQETALRKIRQVITQHRIPVHEIAADDRSQHDGLQHDGLQNDQRIKLSNLSLPCVVLHPPPHRVPGNDNANSLVLQIVCGQKSLLLPGDLEGAGTDAVLRIARPPPGGVLMAPHHGSLSPDATAISSWFRPSETVVSGGVRARRPAVSEMLSFSGSGVHVTATVGAVRVRIDQSGKICIQSWAKNPW